ncbi:MAG: hypothetical protein J6Z79_00680 [Clostridia bacterium]|nr:hypothetical protein [Clostridia bacterium]
MKTKSSLTLLLALALLLTGCASGSPILPDLTGTAETDVPESAATEEAVLPPGDTSGFCAGVGRADITPENSVPLQGYGNVEYRLSERVLDPLYVTCVAVRDEEGETVLLFNLDLCGMSRENADKAKGLASEDTGIPADHMITNSTHTHSAPSFTSDNPFTARWIMKVYQSFRKAASAALADLDACVIEVGKTDTDRLNFVRRYYREGGGFATDHGGKDTGPIVAHESENDPEMRLIRFVRENRKDIVLANWQCHPHRTGGSNKYDVSADIIGTWRKNAEADGDLIFAFFQGGAGNETPFSRLSGEVRYTDYRDIGRALNEHMREGLSHMTELPAGRVRVLWKTMEAPYNHANEDKLPQAQEIATLFANNDRAGADQLCAVYGISSVYEARSIVNRAGRPETGSFSLAGVVIGEIAVAACPFEIFCQLEKELREASPFAFTFSCGYSNDTQGYLPAYDCFPNEGYEVCITRYARGTGEAVTAAQIELLNELYATA